ncbi:carbonic anhydrase-related protein 10 [Galendromus occidentalis]|uniref:Carbonic anhydrase-related protein 10 n=1 Tax=Galendromus occidentalis TaxID=34638 RepID=A0AAJ7SHB5_9ACAR|nr:carbonic anhydrase-related protein 10 [Galendromus occidentalis]
MKPVLADVCRLSLESHGSLANWNDWWTYEGISGPDFWGRLNPGLWGLCSMGRRQSPINIEPQHLLFDPNLQPLRIETGRVGGVCLNTGQGVVFRVNENSFAEDSNQTSSSSVHIAGGPLAYSYRIYEIQLHFGRSDRGGSEHLLAGTAFPAEIQIYGYNSDLYADASQARARAHGITAVAVFVRIIQNASAADAGTSTNTELDALTSSLQYILHKGDSVSLRSLSVSDLIPPKSSMITYDGSLTSPGCEETVNWIILNKPLYITQDQLGQMRKLKQGESSTPMAPLGDNFRPVQPLYRRVVRTNIDLYPNSETIDNRVEPACPSMKLKKFYQVSPEVLAGAIPRTLTTF